MRKRPVLEVLDDTLSDLLRAGAARGESWVNEFSAAGSGRFSDAEQPTISLPSLASTHAIRNWLRDLWYRFLFGPSARDRLTEELTGVGLRTSDFLSKFPTLSAQPSWNLASSALSSALLLNLKGSSSRSLSRAVLAYRAAMMDSVREDAPLEWVEVLINLATALWRVGERDRDREALEQAAQIFHDILATQMRTSTPLQRASIQQNLANLLILLGDLGSDGRRYEEAVQAFREALKVLTREREPFQWAAVQRDLARALSWLGETYFDVNRVYEAILTYREALKVFTRELAPLDWAAIQNNIGFELMFLATRDDRLELFPQAIESFEIALAEMAPSENPINRAITMTNLGTAFIQVANLENGTLRLERGVELLRDSIALFRKANFSSGLESASRTLAYAEALLASKQ